MTAPERRPARIAVMAGNMASQQLAFAHLLDVADRAGVAPDLEMVDVLRGPGLERRLRHYFDVDVARSILDMATGCDTVVLLTRPDDLPARDTDHLRWLGVFSGHLVRATPERPC